jgi:hypothetical protein
LKCTVAQKQGGGPAGRHLTVRIPLDSGDDVVDNIGVMTKVPAMPGRRGSASAEPIVLLAPGMPTTSIRIAGYGI